MIKLTEEEFNNCKREFLNLGQEGLFLNHYELAEQTMISEPMVWKSFLTDPRTVDYISSEMNIIRNSAINAMVAAAPGSTSVGQSQLINALDKINDKESHKDGPAFIYCYVPLNREQKEAPNVRKVNAEGIEETEDGWIMEED